jgi:hypothetical protein
VFAEITKVTALGTVYVSLSTPILHVDVDGSEHLTDALYYTLVDGPRRVTSVRCAHCHEIVPDTTLDWHGADVNGFYCLLDAFIPCPSDTGHCTNVVYGALQLHSGEVYLIDPTCDVCGYQWEAADWYEAMQLCEIRVLKAVTVREKCSLQAVSL